MMMMTEKDSGDHKQNMDSNKDIVAASTPAGEQRPVLGFFLGRRSLIMPYQIGGRKCIEPQFLYTSQRGKELKQGLWGNLDDSLGFLGTEVNIYGSSNGFLLCSTRSKADYKFHYVVCNPVTGEFRVIPTSPELRQPQHGSVALAFVCEGASTSLDEVLFEVIRGSMESYAVETLSSPTLEVARFSSYTNAWTTEVLVSDTPFSMRGCKLTACIAGGVIYWSFVIRIGKDDVPPRVQRVQWYGVLAYDRAARTLRVIQLPWNVIREECAGCHGRCSGSGFLLDAPEGKLHIASHGHHKLVVWALEEKAKEDNGTIIAEEWVKKREIRVASLSMFRHYSSTDMLSLIGFHPRHSHLLLIGWNNSPFWCNFESPESHMDAGCGVYPLGAYLSRVGYFPYEWPLPLPGDKLLFDKDYFSDTKMISGMALYPTNYLPWH